MAKVRMLAYMDGEIRNVELPKGFIDDQRLTEKDLGFILHNIFRFGQNEFQPQNDRCSVSVGDVIEWGDLYMVCTTGFRKLTQQEYDDYVKLDRPDRPLAAMKMSANVH